jgi:hypothetical protein
MVVIDCPASILPYTCKPLPAKDDFQVPRKSRAGVKLPIGAFGVIMDFNFSSTKSNHGGRFGKRLTVNPKTATAPKTTSTPTEILEIVFIFLLFKNFLSFIKKANIQYKFIIPFFRFSGK